MTTLYSAYAATVSGTVSFTGWWLKDPQDPTLNYQPDFYGTVFKRLAVEEQAVFSPLGRRTYVVVRGQLKGEQLTLPFEAVTAAAFQKFQAIRAAQRTLLLQRGDTGEQWYGVLSNNRPVEEAGYDPNFKQWEMTFNETDAP